MKCTNCGFTYDEESICPICGTPAPHTEPTEPAPLFEGSGFSAPATASPRHVAPKAEPPAVKSAPQPIPKGLLIATLCVLSVTAAALIGNAFLQSAVLLRDSRRASESSYNETIGDVFETEPSDPANYADNAVHKVGESFSFNGGTVCLKSIKLTGAASALDKNARQAACTVVIANAGKRTQSFYWPGFHFTDEAFDEAHFLYSETDQGNKEFFTLAPGKSLTAVYYYTLPKDNQKLRCNVSACGFFGETTVEADNSDFTVNVTYEFETKNVK